MTTSFSPCLIEVPVSLQIYFITRGIHSFLCFEVPTKRGLMAFVRSQEEALDFEVAAPINCRSTPSTAAQGLQLDIPRRLRTPSVVGTPPTYGVPTMDTSIRMCWSRQKCLQRRC